MAPAADSEPVRREKQSSDASLWHSDGSVLGSGQYKGVCRGEFILNAYSCSKHDFYLHMIADWNEHNFTIIY